MKPRKWTRRVLAVHTHSDPAYVDLLLNCGHLHAVRRRRHCHDEPTRSYPASVTCPQCRDLADGEED